MLRFNGLAQCENSPDCYDVLCDFLVLLSRFSVQTTDKLLFIRLSAIQLGLSLAEMHILNLPPFFVLLSLSCTIKVWLFGKYTIISRHTNAGIEIMSLGHDRPS